LKKNYSFPLPRNRYASRALDRRRKKTEQIQEKVAHPVTGDHLWRWWWSWNWTWDRIRIRILIRIIAYGFSSMNELKWRQYQCIYGPKINNI